MDTDRAYLFGLIIGGGNFGNSEDILRIKLPFNKWGSYTENPQRAGQISQDILSKIGPMFKVIYGLNISYETMESGTWIILCEGDTTGLKNELSDYGINCNGEVKRHVNIKKVIEALVDDNMKRRFIAGIADTIGSMAKSHRRFTDEHQIISLEISGYNYEFVCDLCHLLYSINCIPDQVNWNHPNIHSTGDCYYKQWNKGFKLRILLDQYAKFGAFAFRTKAESLRENRKLQQETHSAEICENRDFHITPSTVHPAENDKRLPETIRGGHFLNFRHFCAVLGCEHAPYGRIKSCLKNLGRVINPFPILCKRSYFEIKDIIDSDKLLYERKYSVSKFTVASFYKVYNEDNNYLMYGNSINSGYPISAIIQGIAYIIADDDELNGNKLKGNYNDIIKRHLIDNPDISVEIRKPDLLTPLVIVGKGKGTLIGARNPNVYNKLISFDPNNEYKILVRQITEEDLRNA